MLEELKPPTGSKCRGMLTGRVVLHHDNTHFHTVAVTTGTI